MSDIQAILIKELGNMAKDGRLILPRAHNSYIKDIGQICDAILSPLAEYEYFGYSDKNWSRISLKIFPLKGSKRVPTYVLGAIGLKACKCCDSIKQVAEFSKGQHQCKACGQKSSDSWLERNREHRYSQQKDWGIRTADKRKEVRGAYYLNNKDKNAARASKRRAAVKSAIPKWAEEEKISRLFVEAKKWSKILGVKLHVDHIVPLNSPVVCGLHCFDNFQLLEASANLSKSNRLEL
jgi:hypothetical protein